MATINAEQIIRKMTIITAERIAIYMATINAEKLSDIWLQ